jgi:hypothetical protein
MFLISRIRTEISETIESTVFKWFYNGLLLESNGKTEIVDERYVSTLNIINVQHSDAGKYECLVENTTGQKLVKSSCTIKISG